MSISLNANFELLSAGLYLDARQQFNTLIEMKDFAETSIPDGFITYNKETQKHYVFNSSNTVDATLGKWREYNRGGGSSEKQIKDWVSGSSYLEGDYIYHEGELYRCIATNNNVDFNETNWEQLTYGIDELTKEDVERLLGLTKEEIEAMADLILDTEVRIDKTHSSSKIYTDIQQCLQDSKTYTDEQVATMNVDNAILCDDKPTYDGVDTISYTKHGVLETTTEKDAWFYYVDVDGILKQTRFIDNEEVTIISGGTVDFGDYVSKSTDVVSDYTGAEVDTAKVPDLSALHAMETLIRTDINSKVSTDLTDLENRVTTNEADITELQEQIDNLDVPKDVDLTEIKTKLTQLETKTDSSILRFPYWNNNATDTYLQIPAPTTLSKQSPFITITSSQGGCIILLAGDSTTQYKFTKCVRLSHDNLWSHDATDAGTEKLLNVYVDKSNGYIYVKLGANVSVGIIGINEAPVSVTTLPTDVIEEVPIVDLTQDELNHSTVNDVPKTTLTPLFPSVVKVASGGVAINYIVRNGWCNVNFKFNITSSTTFSWTDIAWGLPIPANSIDTVLMSDGKATQPIPIKITSTGSVSSKVISAISTTDWWTGNITYPAAE